MNASEELGRDVGIAPACRALHVSRATLYRHRKPVPVRSPEPTGQRRSGQMALTEAEAGEVLDTLNTERFADQPSAEIYAALLGEGIYLCSIRTMYRVLFNHGHPQ